MAMMLGCLGIMAIPIALFISIQIAGFFGGMILFLVVMAAAFGWIVNAARSGMGMVEDAITAIPIVGALYTRFLKPVTYYSIDSRTIFEETVHRVVLNHIASLLTISKLPPLTAAQMVPQVPGQAASSPAAVISQLIGTT
jgi:hypothetical protein